MNTNRADHFLISRMVNKNSRILDIGCADGKLLHLLKRVKNVSGQGIEIDHDKVETCLRKGLSVIEGDANKEITSFPKESFDYVILSQTLQTVERPRWILDEILRIGKSAIISFPNFGYWLCRVQILFKGRMPITNDLKLHWYDTQNIHLCTIKDFSDLVNQLNLKVDKIFGLNRKKVISFPVNLLPLNLLASHAVFLISKKK
ncbi:MAG: methionine biosynthesis protein MetW [Rickettsiales bacterium]|nr:methionine biosynthesis protein MetW [Rickettsiales bacterium]OUV75289.1 MAG: methionine biosynthesis protein MetW [Rickettsiales bacterium TMED131]